ncbi:serine-rich adhesin for platelets [Zeugodacus cucurbitae]|uniref:serine-rich adhesin for platelets n=1 Tax=Zeugodacus cucurbitae TaxID=28588 RepID=UPI00059692DE|nr:serine-rich adhesin for platelets [Zeugodacus cucurbitae]
MEMDTNSNEATSPYSEVEDVGNTEEISVKSSDEVEIDWDALIANTNITTRPINSKPRRTFEEYVSTQKVYDVLKDPDEDTAATTTNSIELKKTATTTTNTISTMPATTKNTTEFDKSTTSSVANPLKNYISNAQPLEATTTTNTTISTTVATTTNTIELEKSTTRSVVMPLKSDIRNVESPEATAETKNYTSNSASSASTTIAATTTNEITTTNTAPIAASSANSIAKLTSSIKKSVMRPVHIPLSIASKAHKSITLKGQKIPMHPLIKSRNCVLISTRSSSTAGSKGIIKFIPRNSYPEKYVADKCYDSNTTDSNSGEAFSIKESDEVAAVDEPIVDKEDLVTTSDNNAETAINIPIVPLVGKRKCTDPATMPILSFSYQKSLADYIRKAKEFHKRAKMCSAAQLTTIGNSNSSEENVVSNDIESVNSIDGNDETNMECDDESNVAKCKSNENRQEMDVEQTTNTKSEISENVTATKTTTTSMEVTKTTNNRKDMEKTESIEKIHTPLDSNGSRDNLEKVESAEDAEATKDVESTARTDKLKILEKAETLKDVESNESIDNVNAVKSIEITKNQIDNKSAEGTDIQNDVESGEDTKNRKDIESAKRSNDLKDVESSEGIKNLKDTELAESTNVLKDVESAKDTKTLEDIELAESTDNLKDEKSAEGTENPIDIDLSKSIDNESSNVESDEATKTLEDIESAAGTDNQKDMETVEDVDNTKNITTTSDTGSQIDIESDLCTYEIFNNISGISNANRNQLTQTKDSTVKILKNIWELKEKVQQQAEEIMSLKAAMKFLNTTNVLNKS